MKDRALQSAAPGVLTKGGEHGKKLHLQKKVQGKAGIPHPGLAFHNVFSTPNS